MLAETQNFPFSFSWKLILSHVSGRLASGRHSTASAAIFVCLEMSQAFSLLRTSSLNLRLCHKKRSKCSTLARMTWWHSLKPKDMVRPEKAGTKKKKKKGAVTLRPNKCWRGIIHTSENGLGNRLSVWVLVRKKQHCPSMERTAKYPRNSQEKDGRGKLRANTYNAVQASFPILVYPVVTGHIKNKQCLEKSTEEKWSPKKTVKSRHLKGM